MHRRVEENRVFSLRTDFLPIYHLLRQKVWFISALTFVAFLLALIYLARTGKVYESSTTVEVVEDSQALVKADTRQMDDRAREERLKTIEQNLSSPALVTRLIRREELADDADFRSLTR